MKHIKSFAKKVGNKKPGKKNIYEIIIDFMVGDADGEEKEKFSFSADKMDDPKFKELVSDFVYSIQGCISLDSNGRCGFDSILECVQWYAGGFDRCDDEYVGVPSWSRFCEDVTNLDDDDYEIRKDGSRFLPGMNGEGEIEMEPFQEDNNPFIYNIPSRDDFYCSYENIRMYYYDENGEKSEIDLE